MKRRQSALAVLLALSLLLVSCRHRDSNETKSSTLEEETTLGPAVETAHNAVSEDKAPRELRWINWLRNAVSLGVGSARLLKDNSDLGGLKLITAVMKTNQIMIDAAKKFESEPVGKELLAEMYGMDKEGDLYWPKVYDPKKYAKMEQGSFGRAYYDFMQWYSLDPHPRRLAEPAVRGDTVTYIYTRYRQTHDFFHVLLGLGPSPAEEIGVHAFGLAQGRTPPSVLIVAGGVLQSMALGQSFELCMRTKYISHFYALGLRASPLIFNRWEELVDSGISLAELRSRLGLAVLNRVRKIHKANAGREAYSNITYDPTDECKRETQ